jgi:hypothetical protein
MSKTPPKKTAKKAVAKKAPAKKTAKKAVAKKAPAKKAPAKKVAKQKTSATPKQETVIIEEIVTIEDCDPATYDYTKHLSATSEITPKAKKKFFSKIGSIFSK